MPPRVLPVHGPISPEDRLAVSDEFMFLGPGWDGWYLLTTGRSRRLSASALEAVAVAEARWVLESAARDDRLPWIVARHPTTACAVGDSPPYALADVLDSLEGRTAAPFSLWRVGEPWRSDEPAALPLTDLAEPPAPADEPPPAQITPTRFELNVVDEIGEPIDAVATMFLVDGVSEPTTTDSSGRVEAESPQGSSFASASITDLDPVREALADRWAVIRDEPLLEDADDHTFVTCSAASNKELPRFQLVKDTPHTVVFHPDVVLARFIGMFFNTNKSFLLPNPDLPRLKPLYESNPDANLLIVGHTDTSGEPAYNEELSLERAESISAYLRDDVDAWMQSYTNALPFQRRWGSTEDRLMLDAILRRDPAAPKTHRVRYYQESRGLSVDGDIGSQTRRSLVTDYMGLDGVTVPETMSVETHGCGESFPLDRSGEAVDEAPADGADDAMDRRVELFFFGDALGVLPPPPESTSAPGSAEYPQWRKRARQTLEFSGRGVELAVRVCDDNQEPMPGAVCTIEGIEVLADDQGFVVLPPGIAGETTQVQWHAAPPPDAEAPPDDGFEADDAPDPFERRVFVRFPDGEEGARRKLHNLGYDHDQALKAAVTQYQQDFELEATGALADIQESLDTWHDGGNPPGPVPPGLDAASPDTLDGKVGKKRATAATRLRPLLMVRVLAADGGLVDPALLDVEVDRLNDQGNVEVKLTETGRGNPGGTLDVEFSRTLRKIHEIRTHLRRADGTTVAKETRRVKVRAAKILADKKSIVEVQLAVPAIRDATDEGLPAKTIPDGGDQSYVAVPRGPLIGTVSHIWKCDGSAAIDGSGSGTVVKVKAASVSGSVGDTTLKVTQTESGFP